jgi:hypothetical protein
LIDTGGIWFSVCHKVGPVGDTYTVPTSIFAKFMDYVASKMATGEIVTKTVEQALTT